MQAAGRVVDQMRQKIATEIKEMIAVKVISWPHCPSQAGQPCLDVPSSAWGHSPESSCHPWELLREESPGSGKKAADPLQREVPPSEGGRVARPPCQCQLGFGSEVPVALPCAWNHVEAMRSGSISAAWAAPCSL